MAVMDGMERLRVYVFFFFECVLGSRLCRE